MAFMPLFRATFVQRYLFFAIFGGFSEVFFREKMLFCEDCADFGKICSFEGWFGVIFARRTLTFLAFLWHEVAEGSRWVEPAHCGVSLEPCELFLGIHACVLLYALAGGDKVHFAIHPRKHFLETYGVE